MDDDGIDLDQQRAEEQQRAENEAHGQALLRSVDLGVEVVKFLSGRVGDHLIARATEDERQILEKFTEVDPDDPKAIRAIQTELGIVRQWQRWLLEIVNEGKQAEVELAEARGS